MCPDRTDRAHERGPRSDQDGGDPNIARWLMSSMLVPFLALMGNLLEALLR
jgi:hypothetical protein